jgi:hypothetical protein
MTVSKGSAKARPRLKTWESDLFDEILARHRAASAIPYARHNFLVHETRVFFIDMAGWWHSQPGEAHAVAAALRAAGVRIVRAKLVRSDALWTPYFGRTGVEEPNRGWNDPTIELKPAHPAHTAVLLHALGLHRAQLERKRFGQGTGR